MNGTFVNGQRVKTVTLATGDSVAYWEGYDPGPGTRPKNGSFLAADGAEARRA